MPRLNNISVQIFSIKENVTNADQRSIWGKSLILNLNCQCRNCSEVKSCHCSQASGADPHFKRIYLKRKDLLLFVYVRQFDSLCLHHPLSILWVSWGLDSKPSNVRWGFQTSDELEWHVYQERTLARKKTTKCIKTENMKLSYNISSNQMAFFYIPEFNLKHDSMSLNKSRVNDSVTIACFSSWMNEHFWMNWINE